MSRIITETKKTAMFLILFEKSELQMIRNPIYESKYYIYD